MSQQQQKPEIKMGPVDLALYGAILCIHYPLKFTIATYKTSKSAVVTTVSLPKRAINYSLSTASSIKAGTERKIKGTINLTRNTFSYALGLLGRVKEEANHQFETKIHEPKLQYEKALSETATSISDYTVSKANSVSDYTITTATTVKTNAQGIVQKSYNFIRNASNCGVDILKMLTEDVTEFSDQKLQEPKTRYERTFAKFQAAAFETERQILKDEILKLHEELKRGQQQQQQQKNATGFDNKERFKCDKQIHDLQEQLARIHLTYTQQKQHLIAEFEKERLQLKQEIQKLGQQITKIQANYENLCKQQLTGFEAERHQYQEEIRKLRESLAKREEEIRNEGGDANGDGRRDGDEVEEEEEELEEDGVESPYVTEILDKIETIRKDSNGLKKIIGDFTGTEQSTLYIHLNDHLIRNLIKLDNIKSRGYNVIKKRRKEAMKCVEKLQAELKSKV